ncbi:MAG: sulfatase-like hydrolase/transferase, partial [Phenylobacterium sp.]
MGFRITALCLALATAAAAALPAGAAQPARKPNVIIILADDLGTGDVGAYGGQVARTPNIDALAAGGVRLTQGHVTAPICSPSRVALLSGRHNARYGFEHNPVGVRTEHLPVTEPTIAHRMKALGYITGLVGKWHLGWRPELRPDRRGFDSYYGMASGSRYYPGDAPGVERMAFPQLEAESAAAFGEIPRDITMFRNGRPEPVTSSLTDKFTDEAIGFITAHKDRPFFLYLAYNAPHTPLEADADRLARFPADLRRDQRILAAMTAALDDGVGRISETLRTQGLDRDTLVIFLSDNGCPRYLRGACFDGGLNGGKRHLLQGGVRVPFIISWPGVLAPGSYDGVASSLDIAPTALAAAGAEATPRLDGVDLVPFLTGRRPAAAHPDLYWRATPSRAVRSGDWKLIQAETPQGARQTFLFNLRTDPGETRNLAKAQPAIAARLA